MQGNRSHSIASLTIAWAAATLCACSSTTSPGAADVTRRQLLIVPSATVEQMAKLSFDEQNRQAKRTPLSTNSR